MKQFTGEFNQEIYDKLDTAETNLNTVSSELVKAMSELTDDDRLAVMAVIGKIDSALYLVRDLLWIFED